MGDKTGEVGFNWRLHLRTATAACAVYLAIIVFCPDIISFLYIFAVAAVIVLVAIGIFVLLLVSAIRKKPRQRLAPLLMLVTYAAVTGVLLINHGEIRPSLRWVLWSHRYKAELLRLRDAPKRELKHVEWDVSGWGPVGPTFTYLVFDPTDSLRAAAKSHQPGTFSGIPCEVPRVQRLESHWYAVRFYTEESWGERNRLNCSGLGN